MIVYYTLKIRKMLLDDNRVAFASARCCECPGTRLKPLDDLTLSSATTHIPVRLGMDAYKAPLEVFSY